MGQAADAVQEEFAGLREGLLVGSKYRLVEQLGTGAMGAVWSATHLTLGHAVAIKFLHGSVMSSETARQRFDREARLAARLGEASRHITRVIDHGLLDDSKPFLVMELLRGEGLSTYLKREKRISLQKAARIVQHLARALHVTHSAGVIHRDLKPANIFLCHAEDGDEIFVKLLDFGIAKATMELDDESTGAGTVLGTPSYMSPEQVMGDKTIDVRSDLWAVAAIVYRMTCGRPPFGGGAVTELGLRILSNEPAPPSQVIGELPIEFDMWMARGLAKKPEERFQTVRELADFLGVVAGTTNAGTSTVAPPPVSTQAEARFDSGIASSTGDTPAGVAPASLRRSSRPPPRRRSMVPVIVVVSVAALIGAVAIGARLGRRAESASASSGSVTPSIEPVASTQVPATPSTTIAAKPVVSSAPVPSALPPRATGSGTPPKKKVDTSGWANKKEL